MNESNYKDLFNEENRTKYFHHLLVILCVVSVLVFSLFLWGDNLTKKGPVARQTKPNPFENIVLEAEAAVVWDVVNQRVIFSKNPDVPLPLASLTKVMTAVTAESLLPDDLDIKISEEHLEPDGDSGLKPGDIWKAKDLRDFTLLTSSNDGALALAVIAESRVGNNEIDPRLQFIKNMNKTALTVGLINSKFFNEHGLDREADRGGAYGSARDMAVLFEYTLKNHPNILEATRYENLEFKSTELAYQASNTNPFINQIPGIIASKTGFTDLAGGNLVVAYDAGLNRPIIISVLGSSQDGRFSDTLKLVGASLDYISNE